MARQPLMPEDREYLLTAVIFNVLGAMGFHHFQFKNIKMGLVYLIGFACTVSVIVLGSENIFLMLGCLAHAILIIVDLIRLVSFKLKNAQGYPVRTNVFWIRWLPVLLFVIGFISA